MCFVLRGAVLGAAGCSFYGSQEEHSRFISAAGIQRNTIAFSFAISRYRPPRGVATFPDGGSRKYTVDDDVIAMYDVTTKGVRVLEREANTKFTSDGGHFVL